MYYIDVELYIVFSFQVENISQCLTFLASLGVNVEGLSAKGKCIIIVLSFLSLIILITTHTHLDGGGEIAQLVRAWAR